MFGHRCGLLYAMVYSVFCSIPRLLAVTRTVFFCNVRKTCLSSSPFFHAVLFFYTAALHACATACATTACATTACATTACATTACATTACATTACATTACATTA
eukprot:scpid96268/ scgid4223/ 